MEVGHQFPRGRLNFRVPRQTEEVYLFLVEHGIRLLNTAVSVHVEIEGQRGQGLVQGQLDEFRRSYQLDHQVTVYLFPCPPLSTYLTQWYCLKLVAASFASTAIRMARVK